MRRSCKAEPRRLLLLAAAGATLAGAQAARAQTPANPALDPSSLKPPEQLGQIPIDKLDPQRSIPTPEEASRNPLQFGYLLMDLATQAELAEKRGDFADAVRYYQALARAVPHRSISYGKMCAAHEALGNRDEGLAACRSALGREGVRLEDHHRAVRLLLGGPGPLQAADREDVLAIASHLRRDPATTLAAHEVQCQLATRIEDAKMLEACVAGLTAAAPGRSEDALVPLGPGPGAARLRGGLAPGDPGPGGRPRRRRAREDAAGGVRPAVAAAVAADRGRGVAGGWPDRPGPVPQLVERPGLPAPAPPASLKPPLDPAQDVERKTIMSEAPINRIKILAATGLLSLVVIVAFLLASGNSNAGSLALAATLSRGTGVAEITYRVTGNGIPPIEHRAYVADPDSPTSVTVKDLPAASGYRLEVSGASPDGTITCGRKSSFDIEVGKATHVSLAVPCRDVTPIARFVAARKAGIEGARGGGPRPAARPARRGAARVFGLREGEHRQRQLRA